MGNNIISDDIYSVKKPGPILAIIGIIVFALTFIINFPLKQYLNATVSEILRKEAPCPIAYTDLNMLYFMPGVELNEVNVSASCSRMIKKDITLSYIDVRLIGFDFAVFAPKFAIETTIGKSSISHVLAAGNTEIFIGDIDMRLDLAEIGSLVDLPLNLSGTLDLVGEIDFEGKQSPKGGMDSKTIKYRTIALNAYSKNLFLLESNIKGIVLPDINIGPFEFIVDVDRGESLEIQNFVIGKAENDIHGTVEGNINLVQKDFMASQLALNTTLKLSNKISRTISILDLLLGQFKNKDTGYYEFDVKGTLRAPRPTKRNSK